MIKTAKRNRTLFTIGFLVLCLVYSCSNEPRDLDEFMVDVSAFNMNDSILKDGDYVEILGSSGNLTENHEIDFYNLVVVRCEETGDTVNVLVTTFYQADLNSPRTRFISNSSLMGKLIENTENAEELDGTNINDLKPRSFRKVFYDREYIQVDVTKYPTITGTLGDYTIEGDLSELGL